MPYCPKCEAEYRPGFAVCSGCRVELVDERPAGEAAAEELLRRAATIRWVPLRSVYDEVEADLVCGLLESHGIPTWRRYTDFSAYVKLYLGHARGVEILVPEENLPEARELIAK